MMWILDLKNWALSIKSDLKPAYVYDLNLQLLIHALTVINWQMAVLVC